MGFMPNLWIDPDKIRGTERDRKILLNIKLVFYCLKKYYWQYLPNKELAKDLFSVGCIGLIKAIDKYDGRIAFSSYAMIYVRGEIGHFIRDKYPMIRNRNGDTPKMESLDKIDRPAPNTDPCDETEIELLLKAFHEEDRVIIRGRMADKGRDEIAREIGKTPITVTRRLNAIRERIRENPPWDT